MALREGERASTNGERLVAASGWHEERPHRSVAHARRAAATDLASTHDQGFDSLDLTTQHPTSNPTFTVFTLRTSTSVHVLSGICSMTQTKFVDRPASTSLMRDILVYGAERIASHPGSSQYTKGSGISACGLAALNFARVTFRMEEEEPPEHLLHALLSKQTTDEILAICMGWSSNLHLEVEDIYRAPLFERSLKLRSTKYGRPGLGQFKKLLGDLDAIDTSAVVLITRPPEIIACLKLIVSGSSVFVIFDSHPRPLYPHGAGFMVNASLAAAAQRLADLLPIVDLPDGDLQWQAQLLSNYSGHIFVSRGQDAGRAGLTQALVEASLQLLTLQAEAADLRSQNAMLTSENKNMEIEMERMQDEYRRERRRILQSPQASASASSSQNTTKRPWPTLTAAQGSRTFDTRLSSDSAGSPSTVQDAVNLQLAFEQQRRFDEEDRGLRAQLTELAQTVQATFDCRICMDEHPEDSVARLEPCGHGFCRDCMRSYVTSKLNENRFPVLCPVCTAGKGKGKEATGEVTEILLQQLGATNEQYDKWVEMEMAAFSVLLHCRKCKRSAYVDKQDLDEKKIIACPFRDCSYIWCKACQQTVEIGAPQHSCDGSSELDHLMKQRGWKYCPTCKTPIQKVSGCNHMSCMSPACNTHFCYRCGELIIQSALKRDVQSATTTHYRRCALFEEVPDRGLAP